MKQKNKQQIKLIFTILTVWLLFFSLANFAMAQVSPFGGTAQKTIIQNALGLGSNDPRVTIANIIRIALGFLGIIAIGLILYGGWLWLTSAGEASKIERAKKLFISAGIGLLIILASWGIVTFILNAFLTATGAPGICTPACLPGEYCCSGSCQATPCTTGTVPGPGPGPGPGPTPVSCDTDPGPACVPGTCTGPFYCDSGCLCQPTGGVGDPCDADTATAVCDPDPNMCSVYLQCDAGSCTCEGAPVVEWLSPGDGAVGNFITIGGRYFGTTTGSVYFSDLSGSTTVLAQFPNTVNAACTNNWTENQIIVVVPSGTAALSAVRVVRADGQQDQTDDARGPAVDDFIVNTTVRPGLCLVTPTSGVFESSFTVQGNNFNGTVRSLYFGGSTASTSADNVNFISSLSATGVVPNINPGNNTIFASVDGRRSNVLAYLVLSDPNNDPVIEYIDPAEGPIGQYVTIYGRNFKNYLSGSSGVTFENSGTFINADIDFPAACQNGWWRDRYIIVKVPTGVSLATWRIQVTNSLLRPSNFVDFIVTTGTPGPGLCALVPHNGPVGQSVQAHGDRFGTTAGTARYYNNQPGVISGPWTNQSVTSLVPAGAETGPFRIVDSGSNVSNSLNFTVGICAATSDCESGEECCGGGTFDGICRTSGTCGDGTLAACTFAWTFTTNGGVSTSTTCSGYSGAAACLAAGSCPNSPGQCQTSTSTVSGPCGDDYCNSSNPVCAGECIYDSVVNKCKLTDAGASVAPVACDQTDNTLVTGYTAECRRVGAAGRWQINVAGASCPLGSFRDTNNWCSVGALGSPVSCDICANGFNCQGNECVINRNICPAGSSCNAATEQCISGDPTCECCCRVANSAEDCCAGLTCEAGGCGSDPLIYGQCTGCRVELDGNFGTFDAAEQDASNDACNCTSGASTRVCSIATNPLGVCEDAGGVGAACNDGGACTTGSSCLSGLFCDSASACTCQPVIGLPCDGNAIPGCQASSTACTIIDPDYICDTASTTSATYCTCQPTPPPPPGATCDDTTAICTGGLPSCGGVDYDCLTDLGDCRCCCVPGSISAAGLTCQADKTPCTGGARGLYCGCINDIECGAPAIAGCSPVDTCCHDRPSVIDALTEPAPNSTGVCRNPLLSVTFDQAMDISSFTGNVIVIGDYGTETCPAGTNYLTGGVYKKYNFFSKLWVNLSRKFTKTALALPGNFCAITGLVKGYNLSAAESVLTFAPSNILDAGRDYYAIIRGDNSATASTSEGVLSYYGIGMTSPSSETFNGIPYQGYIWTFETKPIVAGPPADDGTCRLEYVTIEPSSYLFQSILNDTVDDGLNNSLDPTTVDRDKQFEAFAKSSAGEKIVPFAAYSWEWNWLSENESVARVGASTSPTITPAEVILNAQNKKDAKTYLKVTATITVDGINSPTTVGVAKTDKAPIYVFVCENPWPPVVDPTNWPWLDSAGNCTQFPAACVDNNFELYYCRDKAAVGTANDLPAILVEPVVRGTPPTPNQPLKELFFLREELPGGASLTIAPQPDGTRVFASWPAVTGANSYKLYYGNASNNYTETIETTATNLMVTGLTAGRTYYFAVTSIVGASRAESPFSNEVTITLVDTVPPPAPTGFTATASPATERAVDLSWLINTTSDIAGYHIYYGASAGTYGTREGVDRNTSQVTITGLTNGVTYFFAVGAYDASGNEATSTPASAIPGS